jgi:hypothetical protein
VQKNLKTPKTKWSTNTQAKLCTMKYHRFSRRRKKSDYMINTARSKMLASGFFENQVWGAYIKFGKDM